VEAAKALEAGDEESTTEETEAEEAALDTSALVPGTVEVVVNPNRSG
jgi:hypothetical protein